MLKNPKKNLQNSSRSETKAFSLKTLKQTSVWKLSFNETFSFQWQITKLQIQPLTWTTSFFFQQYAFYLLNFRFVHLPWPSPCRGNRRLRAGRRPHGRSCGRSCWSGSWLRSPAARSAAWPRGSSGTHTPRSGRRSSDPSRSKACERIHHGNMWAWTLTLGETRWAYDLRRRLTEPLPHRFMVAASRLKTSKSQESSFSMVWAMRGGMSFSDSGVIRWLGMWWGSERKGGDERGSVQIKRGRPLVCRSLRAKRRNQKKTTEIELWNVCAALGLLCDLCGLTFGGKDVFVSWQSA